jgi:heat shock protein HslJ
MIKVKTLSKKIWLLALVLLLAVACTPGGAAPEESVDEPEAMTIWVGPETADCEGVGPQTCLQVKFAADQDWQLFYDTIVGFEYEPGFEYELLVSKTNIANPPADASSIRYELVEVVQQTAVADESTGSMLDQLLGTDWNLVSWEGMEILPDAVPTLSFEEDGMGGTTGCNHYFAKAAFDGANIAVDEIEMTEMFCEGIMEQESAFIAALQTAESFSLADDTLIIHTTSGNLTFQPPTPVTLMDTIWYLSGIANGDAVVNTAVDSEITAEFKEGQLSGTSACNGYSAPYEVDGNTLNLGDAVSTLMACADEARNQRESEFFAALGKVAAYEIQRDTLSLLDDDGNLVMMFQTEPLQ